ncbi:MAG: tetratricopeptide repeat protein [Desulfopila sp.]
MNTPFRLLVLLLFVSLAYPVPSDAGEVDNSTFQQANALYSRNDFKKAAAIYEKLIKQDGYSVSLLYNLANSYAQAKETGKAVLNYERARRLDPSDPDILANLQLIRSTHGLFTPTESRMNHLFHLLSLNQWAGLGGAALVVLTAAMLLSFWITFSTWVQSLVIVCSAATILISLTGVLELRGEWDQAVILHESPLLISPFAGAATAGTIQAGRMVTFGQHHGHYLFVHDETDRKGWVEQTVVVPVIPQNTTTNQHGWTR